MTLFSARKIATDPFLDVGIQVIPQARHKQLENLHSCFVGFTTNRLIEYYLRNDRVPSLAASSTYHRRWNGWWNRSGRPGDCQINVCSMVPERLADAISKVLNSKNFSALHADNWLPTCLLSLDWNTWKRIWNLHVKQTGTLCSSFICLFHSIRPLLYCRYGC